MRQMPDRLSEGECHERCGSECACLRLSQEKVAYDIEKDLGLIALESDLLERDHRQPDRPLLYGIGYGRFTPYT